LPHYFLALCRRDFIQLEARQLGVILSCGGQGPLKILSVDTATSVGSIALVDGTVLKAEYILNSQATHNRRLLLGIDRILVDSGWAMDHLDAIAVSMGPGSFTGLRIGLSIVKGLAWTTGKPMVGVPTLDALADNIHHVPYLICPVLDARKGEIYTALYRRSHDLALERLTSYMAIKPEKFVELVKEKAVLVGDGLLRYGDYFTGVFGDNMLQTPPHLNVVHASSVAWLAQERLRLGMVEDVTSCAPLYIRPSEAELGRSS
jgi:tRNA threonylcarbamoyladenosine biosynthesis protein TsaB